MYVVIFTAKLKQLDECYYETAAKLKEVAFDQYNCIKFTFVIFKNIKNMLKTYLL